MSEVSMQDRWEAAYESGRDGWDLGGPALAFIQLAASGRLAPGRMLVPGAGRGHDAREFARRGFAVTAVDFAAYAAQEMRRLDDPASPMEILQHDIFALPGTLDGSFDYVLEHTCFCAIDPGRRAEFAAMVARVLRPGGHYITLAFPLDDHVGGPPFAVAAADVLALFGGHGFALVSRETPPTLSERRRGLEELLVLRLGA
jgi:SAM-dependent methyltransferase